MIDGWAACFAGSTVNMTVNPTQSRLFSIPLTIEVIKLKKSHKSLGKDLHSRLVSQLPS